jgi:hypothetical protein
MTSTTQTFLNDWGLNSFPFRTPSADVPFLVFIDHFHHFTLTSVAPKVILHHDLIVGVFFFGYTRGPLYPVFHVLQVWIPILWVFTVCVFAFFFSGFFLFFVMTIVEYSRHHVDLVRFTVFLIDLKNQPVGIYQICIEICNLFPFFFLNLLY